MSARIIIPPFHAKGPALPPPAGWALVQLSGSAMGTDWQLRAYAPPALDAMALHAMVQDAITRTNEIFSLWQPDSEICRINADPAPVVTLSAEMADLLARTLDLAALTGGTSDPALGALTRLWGFGPEGFLHLPDDTEVTAAMALSGRDKLQLKGLCLTRPPGLRLDFNGSAKGWAVDLIARNLLDAGVLSFLIEIGGEVFARGLKPDLRPWWVEIEQPDAAARPRYLVALNGQGMASSGLWRRGIRHGGRDYPHVIDPRTGAPLASDLASVTVLAADVMQADVLAKALIVMGPARGMAFADAQDLPALMLARDGQVLASAALVRMMEEGSDAA